MYQVSRDSNLKIPKKIEINYKNINSNDEIIAIKKAICIAKDKKYINNLSSNLKITDKELDLVSKIPCNSNDLVVITTMKKLGAYVITITEKSPKKFRRVFVNRMQNYCLETLEYLLEANFIRIDSIDKKLQREELQKEAIIKLKLLGYISMVAQSSGCILGRQYKQISIQLTKVINLIIAWKKSDDDRWKLKK